MTDPFAAQPVPAPTPGEASIPCAQCGTQIDPNVASWSENGERICKCCEAVQTIDAGDMRAAQSIIGGGIAAFSIGLTSICFNPFFMLSVMAFAAGVGTLVTIARNPQYRERMGWRYPATIIAAALGIAFSMVIPFIFSLGVLGVLVGA